ncbi:MAG TPA: hypothetical protein VKV06_15740 [Acidimicrobiales bacterium]|nr:hypothetical protein [Acidimicrobiales bacterium]
MKKPAAKRRRSAPAVLPNGQDRVVSVLPAVAGIDRTFDYVVPEALDDAVRIGTVVRVDLHGRRVGGWVVADRVVPPEGLALRPVARVSGWGPDPEVVDLAEWGAWRWAGRRRSLLATASAPGAVVNLPAPDLRPPAAPGGADRELAELAALADEACALPLAVVALPPAADATPLVASVAQRGPTLVIVPSLQRAAVLAGRLRRAGAGVAELPAEWARARAGAGVVIGSRAAAWAPCPGLAAVVVLDAHDEGLVQEQAPCWWVTEVARERAARAGVPCIWVSPCPTLELRAAAPVVTPSTGLARRGWAPVEVVDRRGDDPRLGLYSERLVRELRAAPTAVCVLNRTGRARLLACGACGELARCERCGAAVAQQGREGDGDGGAVLACPRCGTTRPLVCAACDSTRLRQLRIGVSRAREELEALIGRPVGEVTATSADRADAAVVVGTEAVLRRAEPADVVAFLDFDQELLAPRFRAGEEALGLLSLAARLVRGRRRQGKVLVQARTVDHPALRAALGADPSLLGEAEAPMRAALQLPPSRAYAALTGPGAEELAAAGAGAGLDRLGPLDERWLLRAGSVRELCGALADLPRPEERVRIEVDPLRI